MHYYIQTFGCQMNENDSRHIAALLNAAGDTPCDDLNAADIIIVNTCCVRENAENKALGFLGSLKHLKEANPQLIIAVCGCMSQKNGTAELLTQKYRHISIIIGTFALPRLPQYIEQYAALGKTIIDIEERYDIEEPSYAGSLMKNADEPHKAQVNINYGCNNFCTYCIVPYVRGRERSRQPQAIIDEISQLAQLGVKEIQLLGQNVNSYGNDWPDNKWNFGRLLQEVNDINGVERIRYMTSHPRDFSQSLAETIALLPKVCPHFHLPVQSGCDRILKLMNRGYTIKEYRQKIIAVRQIIPDATITTDLIVGFPGETDDDFRQTLEFVKEMRFDSAYTFIYSRRNGTIAANLPNQISEEIKKERLQTLMEIQNPISLSINQQLIGSIQKIMIDGISKNNEKMLSGRTPGNKIVVFPRKNNWHPGESADIYITDAKTWNLLGEYHS